MLKSKSLFALDCLLSVIQDTFMGYADRVDWGYSLESFITGIANPHPNHINELKNDSVSLIDSYKFLKKNQ
jgi:hypothetical protein